MKTFKYIVLGCLASLSAVMTSCGSDYLDTTPTESVNYPTAMGSADNLYKALNGIARTMSTQQHMGSQGECGENNIISLYENYMSQDYYYNAFASGWNPIMNLKYTQNNHYSTYPWYYYYNIIGQANSILANVDKATGDDDLKKFCKGAALTFRAYAYEKLIHYYAPRWQDSNNGESKVIVLRTDESTGDKAPSSLNDVYTQIYKDCQDAITSFESSKYKRPSTQVWIPNVNVAHAVYARAALYRQDYQTALTQATVARNGYPLMSNADYQAGFCKPTSEWIFGSYGGTTENNWYWSFGTQFSCNGYYGSNTAYGAGQISDALTKQIPNTDVRKHLFLTPDKIGWGDSTNVYLRGVKNPNQPTAPFDPVAFKKAVAYMDSIHETYTKDYAAPYQGCKRAGYFFMGSQWKFYVFDSPGVGYLPFIRSSEMLLIEAEANHFLGNDVAAQANLVELNQKTGRDPKYTCTKTGNEMFKEIVKYRSLELWGEGFGFSDYKRWNLPVDRTTSDNASSIIQVLVKPNGTGWAWKIPLGETDYNHEYTGTQNKTVK